MWSKGAPGWLGNSLYIEGFEDSADVSSRRCAGGFVRVRVRCLSAVGWIVLSACVYGGWGERGEGPFFFRLSHFFRFWNPALLG